MFDNEFNKKKKVKMGRISYINVSPVYYGLDRDLKPEWIDMITAPPASLNGKLAKGLIDISPVSSAAYAKNHDQWLLMPDLSISSFGKVMSVILVSRLSIDDLDKKTIFLSEESASSASLVRYIFKTKGIQPEFVSTRVCKPSDLGDSVDAALVIGDAGLTEKWEDHFNHVYDLGEVWMEMTGLPFVFAVWAVRKEFALNYPETIKEISNLFSLSKKRGKQNNSDIVCSAVDKTGLPVDLCENYFQRLDCDLGSEHIRGLEYFFEGLVTCGIIPERIKAEFAA